MRMGPGQAEALVTSYLGRPPQDELEAAVVLESWGGVRTEHALATAGRMAFPRPARSTSARHTGALAEPAAEGAATTAESVGAMAVVLAALVLAAMADDGGAGAVADAWRPAMPATLGATWLLRRRYGAGRRAVAMLRRDGVRLLATGVVLVAPLLALAEIGAMLAAFVVLGVGGAVAVLRGWGPVTAVAVCAVALGAGPAGLGVTAMMATATGVVAVSALAAVATAPVSNRRAQPWRRAVPAGIAGATTGLFMVAVSSAAEGAATWLVGLALAPSLLASVAGGARLAAFWEVVPQALSTIPVGDRATASRRVAQRLLLGGVSLVVALLLVLSAGVRAIVDGVGGSPATVPLLVGFGALSLVALAVTLLEAFARPWWATGTGLAASGAHVLFSELATLTATATVAVAVAAAVVVATPPLVGLLRRPDLTMATLV